MFFGTHEILDSKQIIYGYQNNDLGTVFCLHKPLKPLIQSKNIAPLGHEDWV